MRFTRFFGRYLLLYYYLSKVEYLRSGFVRLLCFERDITRKRERAGHLFVRPFLPPPRMYSVRVCAQKLCMIRKNVRVRENRDGNEGGASEERNPLSERMRLRAAPKKRRK